MLRLFLALLVIVPLACSKDSPAPTAPAGKAVSVQAAPPAPQNLRVETLTDTSALVAWDAAEGATDYDINYKKIGGKWKNWPHRASPLYSTIYGLEPNTDYRWAVRAENRDGPSRWVFGDNFKTLLLSPVDLEEDFQIELVFVSAFTAEQERWIREVAAGWESFFYGLEDSTLSSGETIDDIRILVRRMSSQQADDLSGQSGWNDINVYGSASVLSFRQKSSVPLVSQIRINPSAIEKQLSIWGPRNQDFKREHFWKKTFHHELGHAFGIGPSPAWKDNIKNYGNCDVFFVGENAVRESVILQQMDASHHPFDRYDSRGVRLICQWGQPGGHWSIPVWGIFKTYYLQENGYPNISAISLGAFEDIGFEVNYAFAGAEVGLSIGLLCGQTNRAHLFTGDDLFKICN